MPSPNRRRATLSERTTPCECCGFALSHRHHLLPVARFDEHEHTVQLCPNCHYIYHLIASAKAGNKESQELLRPIMHSTKTRDWYMELNHLHNKAAELESGINKCSDLMVQEWESIQKRRRSGESIDDIKSEYWRRAGLDNFQ